MKRKGLFLLSFLLISCSNEFKDEGVIKMENGEHKEVEVTYSVVDFADFSERFTQDDFEQIVKIAASEAKSNLNFEATFVPLSFMISNHLDTATIFFKFMGKNAFGVPGEMTGYTKFKGTHLIKSFAKPKN